jgi:hypothetical protein
MINALIEHNNKIYNELLEKNIGTLLENKDKSYFIININNDCYSIQSFKYGNKIIIDLIGKEDDCKNYKVLLLGSFESIDSLIKYFQLKYDLDNDLDNDLENDLDNDLDIDLDNDLDIDLDNDLDNDIITNDSIFNNIIEDNCNNSVLPISNYKSSDSLIY